MGVVKKCKCPKNIASFKAAWRGALFSLDAKETVRNELVTFEQRHEDKRNLNPNYKQTMCWLNDIARLTLEIGALRAGLPEKILRQYEIIKMIDKIEEELNTALVNHDEKGIYRAKMKHKELMEYKCEG